MCGFQKAGCRVASQKLMIVQAVRRKEGRKEGWMDGWMEGKGKYRSDSSVKCVVLHLLCRKMQICGKLKKKNNINLSTNLFILFFPSFFSPV